MPKLKGRKQILDMGSPRGSKAIKTLKVKVEYAEHNKLVKKKYRTRALRKRKKLIQELLETRKGPRHIKKHKNKQVILRTTKISGEITSDREKIPTI